MSKTILDKSQHSAGVYPSVVKLHSGSGRRRIRRIIAEDPEWTLRLVPSLSHLCLQTIVENFAEEPILEELPSTQKAFVLEKLSSSLPLSLTANLISDEDYWKRCCKERWSLNDISQYGNSWKRMFFERHLENIIELFIPDVTDLQLVLDLVPLGKNYVRRLKISQLLPPVEELSNTKEDEDDSDSASEVFNDWPSMDHFDFGVLLDKLSNLEELQLMYCVKNCGMNFEWNHFEISLRDCDSLAKALNSCKSLKVFRIHRSKVDDERCCILVKHLLDHPALLELDLSHNLIGDRGAKAIGKLLNRSRLKVLNVYNNQIKGPGAQALAQALHNNTTLESLNLRLNQIGDEGGMAIGDALLKNQTLLNVHLGANDMMEPTAIVFSKVVKENSTLSKLNLSCNNLGMDGGKLLKDGMSYNTCLLECDLRLTEVGLETEHSIDQILRTNQTKALLKQ